jgi:hypothetical protein
LPRERFTSIDRFIEATTEQRVSSERWRARVDATLAGVAQRVDQLEEGLADAAGSDQSPLAERTVVPKYFGLDVNTSRHGAVNRVEKGKKKREAGRVGSHA